MCLRVNALGVAVCGGAQLIQLDAKQPQQLCAALDSVLNFTRVCRATIAKQPADSQVLFAAGRNCYADGGCVEGSLPVDEFISTVPTVL